MKKLLCIVMALIGLTSAQLLAQPAPAAGEPPAGPAAAAEAKPAPVAAAPASAVDPLPKRLWYFTGVFHPATVHIPIGLITLAAMFIVLRWFFPGISQDVPFYALLVGAAGAIGACVMGFSFAAVKGYGAIFAGSEADVYYHRWAGLVATVLAVVLAVIAVRARQQPSPAKSIVWQFGTLGLAALIGLVGHMGGSLTYGETLYADAWNEVVNPTPKVAIEYDAPAPEDLKAPPTTPAVLARIDFVKQVLPVLHDKCVQCHGTEKQKGGLRLDTEEAALKGGDTGPAYIPGNTKDSLILKLIASEDDDEKMPPPSKGKVVTRPEFDAIKSWIEQGAIWTGPGAKPTKVTANAASGN